MRVYHERENAALLSLVGLGLVLASVLVSVWWWSRAAWGDLSLLDEVAAFVGYSHAERPESGYAPQAPGPAQAPSLAGDSASTVTTTAPIDARPFTRGEAGAPFCPAGQAATFVVGFAELKQRLGDNMGEPLECEHPKAANGDTSQQTTTGLAVYRPSTGELSFTDGWRHWVMSSGRLVAWEGQDRPPTAASSNEHARVANTEGRGVVLRSAPRAEARTPRGLLKGAQVTVVERAGSAGPRCAPTTQAAGWVPGRYLDHTS